MTSNLEAELMTNVWSKLASNLEAKLKSRTEENDRFKRILGQKQSENEELKEECNYKAGRINDLEEQVLKKSAKIAQLSEVLEAREPDEVQEKLLEKSLEVAENAFQVDRFRLQVQKCTKENRDLLEERTSLSAANEKLSLKLDKATSSIDQLKKEREKSNKLLLNLSDIVRTLNRVSVSYEQEGMVVEDSTGKANEHSVKNIKRKIDAIEHDRKLLVKECTVLREENVSKDMQISALESHFHSVNITRLESEESEDSQNRASERNQAKKAQGAAIPARDSPEKNAEADASIQTSVGSPTPDRRVEQDDESTHSCSSDSSYSSFSTLDPPDVPMERFEALKREYEAALEKILQLGEELSRSKAALNESQHGKKDTDLKREHKDALREISLLERELEATITSCEVATSEKRKGKKEYEARLSEIANQYASLKRTYDELRNEHSTKLEKLEKDVNASQELFNKQRQSLETNHREKVEAITSKFNDMKITHSVATDAQRKLYEDLNYEYDTFMEIQTELEDELSTTKEKYDEALSKIVSLEAKLEQANNDSLVEKGDIPILMADQSKREKSLQEAAEKSRSAMQEAVLQYQRLKRESDAALSKCKKELILLREERQKQKHGSMEEQHQLRLGDKKLVQYCSEIEAQLRSVEEESSNRYSKLKASYELALDKIDTLGTRLATAGIPLGEDKEEVPEEPKLLPKHVGAFEKITDLERYLIEEDQIAARSTKRTEEGGLTPGHDECFERDYGVIMKRIGNLEYQVKNPSKQTSRGLDTQNKGADESSEASKEHLILKVWYYRLHHQVQMKYVNEALSGLSSRSDSLSHTCTAPTSVDRGTNERDETSWLDGYLRHRKKFRLVNEAVMGILTISDTHISGSETVEGSGRMEGHAWWDILQHIKKLQKVHGELVRAGNFSEAPLLLTYCEFLKHQRKLQIVHYDVLNRAMDTEGDSSSTITEGTEPPEIVVDEVDEGIADGQACAQIKSLPTLEKTRNVIDQLTGELKSVKLVANTARIRYEAREKELRAVLFRYKNLRREYNAAVSNPSSQSEGKDEEGVGRHVLVGEVDSAGDCSISTQLATLFKSTGQEGPSQFELKKLKRDLRATELKVELLNRELRATKEKAAEAQKKQQDRERDLRGVIRQFRELEKQHELMKTLTEGGKHQNLPPVVSKGSSSEEEADVSDIFRISDGGQLPTQWGSGDQGAAHRNLSETDDTNTFDLMASFDGSQLTSLSTMSSASAEARDEKTESANIQFEGGTGRYIKPQHEHDDALGKSAVMHRELSDAKKAAGKSRKKQEQREENLRDVIFQYKKLQSEHDSLTKRLQEPGGDRSDKHNQAESYEELKQERDAAREQMLIVEEELKAALGVAQSAKAKKMMRETHLREVIDQYKALEKEHSLVVEKVERLKKALRLRKRRSSDKGYQIQQEERDIEDFEVERVGEYRNQKFAEQSCVIPELKDEAQSWASQKSKSNRKGKGKGLFRLGLGHFN